MSDNVSRPAVRSDEDPVPHMSPAQFRAEGYLQEVNRLYLHPLGLSLGVAFKDNPPAPGDLGVFFVGVTIDPEGWDFPPFEPHEIERGKALQQRWRERSDLRESSLGFPMGIQPLEPTI